MAAQVHGGWIAPEHGKTVGARDLEKDDHYFSKQSLHQHSRSFEWRETEKERHQKKQKNPDEEANTCE